MNSECGLLSDWLKNQGLNSDGLYDYYQKQSASDKAKVEYELELMDDYFGLYYYFYRMLYPIK